MTLVTELVWHPRACKNGNPRRRGAFKGTLLGVEVDGHSIGRSVAYQLQTESGDVHTVWWDGSIGGVGDKVYPYLYQIDTDKLTLINPDVIVWFTKLEV